MNAAAGPIKADIFRVWPDRLGDVGDGPVELAPESPIATTSVVRLAMLRVESDRLVVIGDRSIKVELTSVGMTSFVVYRAVFGWLRPAPKSATAEARCLGSEKGG